MSHGGPGAPLVSTASAWCGIVEELVVLVVLVVLVAPHVLVVLVVPAPALNITFCCPLTLYWGH